MIIREGLLDDPRVQALLRIHLAGMHENSPPDMVQALDLAGLKTPDITFFTAWNGEELLGMGALREIEPGWGEIKSMRTAEAHLRKGVGAKLLDHILATAQKRGYRRMSLETGSGEAFEAALALYKRNGFINGEAFGDYETTAFNQFLHLVF